MQFKVSFFLAGVLAASSAAAAVGPLVIPIVLSPTIGPGEYAGSFTGGAAANAFSLDFSALAGFDINGTTFLTAVITSNMIFGSGFDVTNALFNAIPFTAIIDDPAPVASNLFRFQGVVRSNAPHTITLNGIPGGGFFTGSVGISNSAAPPSIPEPETYALMLAGLGVVGFVAARRRPRG